MHTVRIADLKNNLSRHLVRVRRGAEITVMDRDTPVARLVPYAPPEPAATTRAGRDHASARIEDLIRQGVLAPGDPRAVEAWLRAHAPVRLKSGHRSAVEVLLEMRRESTR